MTKVEEDIQYDYFGVERGDSKNEEDAPRDNMRIVLYDPRTDHRVLRANPHDLSNLFFPPPSPKRAARQIRCPSRGLF